MAKSRLNVQARPSASSTSIEHCLNPWDNKCKNADIAVYIMYKGRKIPLCWKCWRRISKNNIVWEAY
ncbi:MAG: hypothetical protein QW323_04760 [Candidatus Bathyarchaeia archaeon]